MIFATFAAPRETCGVRRETLPRCRETLTDFDGRAPGIGQLNHREVRGLRSRDRAVAVERAAGFLVTLHEALDVGHFEAEQAQRVAPQRSDGVLRFAEHHPRARNIADGVVALAADLRA